MSADTDVRVLKLPRPMWESFYFGFKAFDHLGARAGQVPELSPGYGDELEIAALEGLATGFGTLTENGWQRVMTFTMMLPIAMPETFNMTESDIRDLLQSLEADAGRLFTEKLPFLEPPTAERVGVGVSPKIFFKELMAVFGILGSPSQHVGMAGTYWRGGAYQLDEDHPEAVLRAEDSSEAPVAVSVRCGEWIQLLKIRSDGWVEARRVEPDFWWHGRGEEERDGWIHKSDLASLQTTEMYLPQELGYTKEGFEAIKRSGVMPPKHDRDRAAEASTTGPGCLLAGLAVVVLGVTVLAASAGMLASSAASRDV